MYRLLQCLFVRCACWFPICSLCQTHVARLHSGIASSMGVKNQLGFLIALLQVPVRFLEWFKWFCKIQRFALLDVTQMRGSLPVDVLKFLCCLWGHSGIPTANWCQGSNVFVAGMVAIVLLVLSPYIYYVPRWGFVQSWDMAACNWFGLGHWCPWHVSVAKQAKLQLASLQRFAGVLWMWLSLLAPRVWPKLVHQKQANQKWWLKSHLDWKYLKISKDLKFHIFSHLPNCFCHKSCGSPRNLSRFFGFGPCAPPGRGSGPTSRTS